MGGKMSHVLCNRGGGPLVEPAVPDNEVLTFALVEKWRTSFEDLMETKAGRRKFAEFLKIEYSDENILFWEACQELKRETNSEKIEEKTRIIYEDFVSILSPKEVSLDSRVRENVNLNMAKPSVSTFDEAQAQIYALMNRDSYPRYLVSQEYKNVRNSFGMIEENNSATFPIWPAAFPLPDHLIPALQPTAHREMVPSKH